MMILFGAVGKHKANAGEERIGEMTRFSS